MVSFFLFVPERSDAFLSFEHFEALPQPVDEVA